MVTCIPSRVIEVIIEQSLYQIFLSVNYCIFLHQKNVLSVELVDCCLKLAVLLVKLHIVKLTLEDRHDKSNISSVVFQICIMSLKLFEVLLQKSHVHIVNNLVLRNLKTRSYFDRHPPTPSPPAPASPTGALASPPLSPSSSGSHPQSPSSPGSPPQSPLSPGLHFETDLGDTALESLTVDSDLPLTNGPTSIDADDEENHIPEDPLLQEGGTPPLVNDQEPDTAYPDSFSDSSLGLDTSRSGLPNSVPQPTSLLPPLSDAPNTNSAISLTTPFDAAGATPSLVGVVPLLLTPAPPGRIPTLVSPAQSSAVTNVPSPLTQLLSSTPDPMSSTMLLGTSPSLSLTSPRSLGSPPLSPGSPTSQGGEDTDHNMHRVVSW